MPKKINSAEFDKLPLFGKGRSSAVFNAILSLKVNEALIITKAEWKPKYPPTKIVTRIEQRFKMKFIRGALPDRSGWAVKRIK